MKALGTQSPAAINKQMMCRLSRQKSEAHRNAAPRCQFTRAPITPCTTCDLRKGRTFGLHADRAAQHTASLKDSFLVEVARSLARGAKSSAPAASQGVRGRCARMPRGKRSSRRSSAELFVQRIIPLSNGSGGARGWPSQIPCRTKYSGHTGAARSDPCFAGHGRRACISEHHEPRSRGRSRVDEAIGRSSWRGREGRLEGSRRCRTRIPA